MERDETDRLEEGRRAVVRETDRWRERCVRMLVGSDLPLRSLTTGRTARRLIESEREVARLKRELEA